ncbi:hypothetical protein WJX75_008755 [Coccomyxa subellipsoidea]|uniref:Uncharacterized protein n=1 Tax=Coccomyxa subellipsoidea TaxID=248742 RepID=A0ABR2YNL4_9CHLO
MATSDGNRSLLVKDHSTGSVHCVFFRRFAYLTYLIAFAGLLRAADCICDLQHPSGEQLKLSWDASRQACTLPLCNGANLLTIPDTSGYVPAADYV